ncbi:type IV pilin protein [Cupriavidus campinensis]|uniref:Type IV pilin protein n=1 Tax=Cupriavidus campinensis TaxID=151783 RepID=A0AAE9HZT8_9BURK|nr:type IV pilin protein [Cupriavidus campinensis]TSP12455.1 type IV pilin protein [Cupriavidus campinensis]URF03367.1 type IV pilin protein [Cupriavidus campinensis]
MTSGTKTRHGGFTLAELMITVAIIGILSAFAYPSYQEFILKGRRTEAKAALMENMQLLERHYSQVNTYYAAGTTSIWTGFKHYSGDNDSSANYTIAAIPCNNNGGQCVELQATPRRADATCGTLVLRTTGAKDNILNSTYSLTPNCW